MNQYSCDIIAIINSDQNINFLHKSLVRFFANSIVNKFLTEHLKTHVNHFTMGLARELQMSDPLPGININQQIVGFNTQFLLDEVDFIKHHVLEKHTPVYVVDDGVATSRSNSTHKSANDVLASWNINSGRLVQVREDTAGDINARNNQYYRGEFIDGIVFCDQSDLGRSNHLEQYENSKYKIELNNMREPYATTSFGVSTPASDARLLERNIFRNGNKIPNYEQRLQRRNLDRDISEGLNSVERGNLTRGYDMSSIYNRISRT